MNSVGDWLAANHPATSEVQAASVTTADGVKGYYVSKDHGQTWNRVHRPTYWIGRLIQWLEKP